MKIHKNTFILGGLLVVALLGGPFFPIPHAQANIGDFFNKVFSSPLPSTSTNPTSTEKPSESPSKPVLDYEQAVVDAVKKASPAVVSITISKNVPVLENCRANAFGNLPPQFQQFFGQDFPQLSVPCNSGKTKLQEVGGGSGFIITADGLILTNKHVVADTTASYTVLTNDGKKYDAKVLARDPAQDLAVIKIEAHDLPTVELGDSDQMDLGRTVIAIGNALGEFRNTVSVGVISGLARTVTAGGASMGQETIDGVLQTDAAINPGNSGGPLLNLHGQVIGIDTAVASGAQNIGFAIPINRAKRDITSVKKGDGIEAPFLGVQYLPVTPEIKDKQSLPVDYGALVRGSNNGPAVVPNSPASKAGIQAEDIILEINGVKLDKDHSLTGEISKFNVGDTITLKINRSGNEISVKVTLTKRPADKETE